MNYYSFIPHITSYVLHQKTSLYSTAFNLKTYIARSFSMAPQHYGMLSHLTSERVPQCPFLKNKLKIPFLKKHFCDVMLLTF